MFTSYLIIALSVLSTLVLGRPAPVSLLGGEANHLSAPPEPGTLRGRHYTLLGHRAPSHDLYPDSALPATDTGAIPAAPRSRPFPKYVADRSDDAWRHVHVRRAVDDTTSQLGAEPNYVSHVGPFAYNAAPSPPLEPVAAVGPAPESTDVPLLVATPASTPAIVAAASPKTSPDAAKTVKAKAKPHGGSGKKAVMGASY